MQSSLEKLRKFFRLEHENGYTDTAVIGGLAKILDFWEADARNEGVPEEMIQLVASRLKAYHRLTPDSRGEMLKGVWKRVTGKAGDDEPLPEVPPASEAAPEPAPDEQPASVKPDQPAPRPAPSVAAAHPGALTSQTPAALNAKLTVLSGVGPRNAQALGKLGLNTLGDMLYFFPRRYDDYSQLKPIKALRYGEVVTVIGTVTNIYSRPIKGGKASMVDIVISDGTAAIRLSFFNQPWMSNRLKEGEAISVSGKVDQYLGRLVMNSPDWEAIDAENLHTNRIVPVYSLTEGVQQKWLRTHMKQVVGYWAPRVADPLTETILDSAHLSDLGMAILQTHFPDSQDELKAARRRLAFDEIFYIQMGVLRQKRDWQDLEGRVFEVSDEGFEARLTSLPFELTGAQRRSLSEMRADLKSGKPMNRLLQGDVGSGKTVVAALAAHIIVHNGAQAAVLAPTSILAEQHFRSLSKMLSAGEDGLAESAIRLLVGDTPESEKEDIRNGLANGEIKVVIGTHALLEEPVQFADLQLAVIDEQHRFGVEQRAALRNKGHNPHLLVMTATPIPRSLQLTVFGDLELSIMDEMPAGRQPIATFILRPQERERGYTLVRSQIKSGHQAFIVYPLIDESDKSDKPAAVAEHARLQKEVFPDLKLGLLHGRMRPDEKDEVMLKFRDREYDILVSTTVIEVGVDVPNATVMLIEGANNFGLAQLHQLRGRVGRGEAPSTCLLIPDHEDKTENERLQAMVETNDGFILAERDLQQRGPGEFLGTRQSGYATTLKMASLTDIELVELAREQATAVFVRDPDLTQPEHTLLAEAVDNFWTGKGDVS